MISTIISIPWPAQWLIGRGVDVDVDVDWTAAAGWTSLQGAVEWTVLVFFVCLWLDWWALYLFIYRIGTVVSVLLQDREFLLLVSHWEGGPSPIPYCRLRWLFWETEGMKGSRL